MHCSLLNLTLSQRLKTHLSIPQEGVNVLAIQLMACKHFFYPTKPHNSRKISSLVLKMQHNIYCIRTLTCLQQYNETHTLSLKDVKVTWCGNWQVMKWRPTSEGLDQKKVLIAGAERCVCVSGSRETNRECARPETEAPFRDHVSNPLPTGSTERENTVQVRQTQPLLSCSIAFYWLTCILYSSICNSPDNSTAP